MFTGATVDQVPSPNLEKCNGAFLFCPVSVEVEILLEA